MLLCLQSEVATVVESQHSLERQLELIETHQQEVPVASSFWLMLERVRLGEYF